MSSKADALGPVLQQLEAATAQFWQSVRAAEAALGVEGFEESIEKGLAGQISSPAQIAGAITSIGQNLSAFTTVSTQVIPSRAMKSQIFTANLNSTKTAQQFFPSGPVANRVATLITPSSNTGNFYIGDSTVNRTQYGMALTPNTQYDSTLDDLTKIFYLTDVVGDTLTINWEWGYGKITP